MSEVCSDNRFELIGKFKGELIDATNIETSPEEMAVLDNILFRMWQMGWLDKLKTIQGDGWQIEKRNCDNVQKTDLVCACGASVLYDQILFSDGHTANRLFCSSCGLSMRSPESDEGGVWLKAKWREIVEKNAPKLLPLDDALDAQSVWLENALNHGIGICRVMPTNNKKFVSVEVFGCGTRHLFKVGTYGILWRCWSAKPSDSQAKGMAWWNG